MQGPCESTASASLVGRPQQATFCTVPVVCNRVLISAKMRRLWGGEGASVSVSLQCKCPFSNGCCKLQADLGTPGMVELAAWI